MLLVTAVTGMVVDLFQGVWSTPKANEKKLNASFKVKVPILAVNGYLRK